MSRTPRTLGAATRLTAAVAGGVLVTGLAVTAVPSADALSGASAAGGSAITAASPDVLSEAANGLADLDTRATVAPTSAQRAAVPSGVRVRWNRYGTPSSVVNPTGYLSGTRSGGAVTVARSWLSGHRTLLGLTAAQVGDLQLLNDSKLAQSKAHVVRFRQQYGGAAPAVDGMVSVAVSPSGRIAYVSSSLSRDTAAAPAATLSPLAAWGKAVAELRAKGAPSVPAADLSGVTTKVQRGWTTFTVPGFAQTQQARLRTLALPGQSTRPVFEVNVVNAGGGASAAYTSYVDAVTGDVLIRRNRTDNIASMPSATNTSEPFQGSFTSKDCGPIHPFVVDAATKSIVVSASAVAADEDIVLKVTDPNGDVKSSDTATSPEAVTYSDANGLPAGTYKVQVCPFNPDPTAPVVVGQYAGFFIASETAAPSASTPYPPEWKFFVANPALDYGSGTTDNRKVGCWEAASGCSTPLTPLQNLAARTPWDVDPATGAPTDTTDGNAAFTGEAWLSPLTPGGGHQMPISLNRHYGFDNVGQDFTDAWNNTKCSPTSFTAANNNNDVLASVTNLFSGHNRMHDFSYFLGFTEGNYNLQRSNFGNAQHEPGLLPGEDDPEEGNVQAGALTGGQPTFEGRDNANQITLQDGIPGITNQYLFQPIAGAFYSPCADGDFDAPVYGHEYTHAISNRMVAGPDDGLSGAQAGAMGESWSDQVALEYLFEHHYDIGTSDPWVEGPYVTGNKVTGIRNYALDKNPLQYGDIGYDVTGPEVHADGEVWSAAMFNVRRQLVRKYNGSFPESNTSLQLRCADASTPRSPLPPQQCPGGRRWIQLMFDSFLTQESGTSMLDARDAYLGADLARFGGKDLTQIWKGFAQVGMGAGASTTSTDDDQPKTDYTSPRAAEGTFALKPLEMLSSSQKPVPGKLYVGDYEARATPIATAGSHGASVRMTPGSYHFVFQANGFGLRRFTATVTAGHTTVRELHLSRNLASKANGATIDGSSGGSLNADSLIDDTEATNWAGVNPSGVSVDTAGQHPFVNVDLAGGRQVVRSVRVSAALRPASDSDDDPDSGSRFTALRQFEIDACTESAANDCSSALPAGAAGSPYHKVFTSPANAFDGVAPRPLAPALLFKTFDIPDTAATHLRIVALENQCTGQAAFAGDQDADPTNDTDCKSGSDRDESVRAAELQALGYDASTRAPGDPVVAMTMTGPAVAAPGSTVTYDLTYRNLGPAPASNADIRISSLPNELQFVSATGKDSFDSTARALRWSLGTVPVGVTRTLHLTTRVAPGADLGDTILTQAQLSASRTFSPPAAAITVVGP